MGIASILAENERLRRELAAREAALAEREAALAERDATIAALTASNENLAQRLELVRLKAADRRNERYVEDPNVPLPFVFANVAPPPRLPVPDEASPLEPDASKPPAPPNRGPNGRPARRDPAARTDRPVQKLRCAVDPSATCVKCGGSFKVFGTEERTARIEWVPGHFETLVVERERCAYPACPSASVLVAPPPNFALPRALCGDGLLARVLTDKFADRIPLNLQAERMKREGEEFSTATLSDWVCLGAKFLHRIAVAIETRLLQNGWLQADDTGLGVQDGTDGKLRKGRLWAYTDQKEVRYVFTDTKEGVNPADFLKDFVGTLLLVDGGSEFNDAVFLKDLLRAGCWSHLRRYLFDARHHHPAEARLALGDHPRSLQHQGQPGGRPPRGHPGGAQPRLSPARRRPLRLDRRPPPTNAPHQPAGHQRSPTPSTEGTRSSGSATTPSSRCTTTDRSSRSAVPSSGASSGFSPAPSGPPKPPPGCSPSSAVASCKGSALVLLGRRSLPHRRPSRRPCP